jgi:hypothetical protein
MRVKISLIAFERAFTSIAQIPRMMGGRTGSVAVDRSEWEPLGDGVEDLFVSLEFDRGEIGEASEDLKNDMRDLEDLSEGAGAGLAAALSRLLE